MHLATRLRDGWGTGKFCGVCYSAIHTRDILGDGMADAGGGNHGLKRELGLRDLVPMQILLVVGTTWVGLAAKQGGTSMVFWVAAILLLFLPSAAVVSFCAKIWPEEGGVYQWTKHVFGPFWGFLNAWNFAFWALLTISEIGIQTATSLSYGLGPAAAWMGDSKALISALSIGLLLLMLAVDLPGFGIGRWVSHFGTAVLVLVTLLLIVLIVVHPHTSAAHPHVSPQTPFPLALPALTLVSVNLFAKMSFNSFTGLEQVAVFAGEIRNPGRAILLSAWIAAPAIAVIYILSTGSILTYVPSAQVDLTGPIPQVLAAAFAGGTPGAGLDVGTLLGRGAILALAIAVIAQYAVILAETSRLPLVAGWDGIVPAWFTRLHPRFGTPVRSLLVMVGVAIVAALVAAQAGNQVGFQLLVTAANLSYGMYYIMMLAIPLVAGARFGARAGNWTLVAGVCGIGVSLLAVGFSAMPAVPVSNVPLFVAGVFGTAVAVNVIGAAVYWRGTRKAMGLLES